MSGTRVTRAVILAAGLGRRLGAAGVPKAMVDVGGRPIVARAINALRGAGVEQIVVVVGHRAEAFAGLDATLVVNPRYAETNNAASLRLARDYLTEDVFVLDGDVVFDPAVLERLTAADAPAATAVAAWHPGLNGTVVTPDADGWVRRLRLARDQVEPPHGTLKTMNLHLLRAEYLRDTFLPRLAEIDEADPYEAALTGTVKAVDCGDLDWVEVDDPDDLVLARFRFGSVDDRLAIIGEQRGGATRFGVADHALLGNPHLPTPAMRAALTADLDRAITEYPAGHTALQALLAAALNRDPAQLVVANGASELIKVLGARLGRTAVVVPNFNEWEAVFDELVRADDLDTALASGAEAVVVTSPGNPTSAAIPRTELLAAARQLAPRRLIVDESFVDFCRAPNSVEAGLEALPNLVVVKSLSKAYGVAGVRLGYLATADLAFAAQVRAALPIWNINGLAEAFLRHLPAFAEEVADAIAQARADRDALHAALGDLLDVGPADANFVLARLPDPLSGPEVVRSLLRDHGILVKDCAGKSMADGERYLRIASRTGPENARLVAALGAVLSDAAVLT